MEYDRDLDGMVKHGTDAKLWCQVCNRTVPIVCRDWRDRLGGRTSLWNYFIPCRFDDCPDGLMKVHARSGGGSPFVPLSDYVVSHGLDGGWEFLPKFPSIPPYDYGVGSA